jgi:hypothetical protein
LHPVGGPLLLLLLLLRDEGTATNSHLLLWQLLLLSCSGGCAPVHQALLLLLLLKGAQGSSARSHLLLLLLLLPCSANHTPARLALLLLVLRGPRCGIGHWLLLQLLQLWLLLQQLLGPLLHGSCLQGCGTLSRHVRPLLLLLCRLPLQARLTSCHRLLLLLL